MSAQKPARITDRAPAFFEDLFKPWNEWFDKGSYFGRLMNIPAVNITERTDAYEISLAVPGMKKDDFRIGVDGNILTISAEKEESKEEKEKKYTRKEYSYSGFSRSFNLPEEVDTEKIDAVYTDGLLNISLPRKTEVKKDGIKNIAVK